jgi:hypothetical protein
VTRFRSVTSQ